MENNLPETLHSSQAFDRFITDKNLRDVAVVYNYTGGSPEVMRDEIIKRYNYYPLYKRLFFGTLIITLSLVVYFAIEISNLVK